MQVVITALAICCALAGTAWAQDAPAKVAAMRKVQTSCRTEAARFCPAASPETPRPRDMLICLRPYRTSLSLGCRGAIDALAAH